MIDVDKVREYQQSIDKTKDLILHYYEANNFVENCIALENPRLVIQEIRSGNTVKILDYALTESIIALIKDYTKQLNEKIEVKLKEG